MAFPLSHTVEVIPPHVPLLLSSAAVYPTPFLPPKGCLRCSPSCLLNHSKIFGWFFVRFSPFLRIASSRSFLFFSFWAAFSFFSFVFSSIFRLKSSFLFLALCLVLPICWIFVTSAPSSPGFGLGSEIRIHDLCSNYLVAPICRSPCHKCCKPL